MSENLRGGGFDSHCIPESDLAAGL